MTLIKGFFRFIGINTFMAFLIFLLIENQATAYFCLVLSIICFTIIGILKLHSYHLKRKLREESDLSSGNEQSQ